MGFRFHKSIQIAPGVKLNFGKKSAGISIGNKYGGVSYNTRTGTRARVSAPGTGISYSTKIGGTSSNNKHNTSKFSSNFSASSGATPPRKNKRTMSLFNFVRWVIAGFMGLCAIVFFPSLASVLLVFLMICALPVPSVIDFLAAKLHLSGKVKPIVMLVVFFVAVMIAPTNTIPEENSDTDKPSAITETASGQTDSLASPEDNDAGADTQQSENQGASTTPASNADNSSESGSGADTPASSSADSQQEPSQQSDAAAAPVTPPASESDTTPAAQPAPNPAPQTSTNDRAVYITETGKRYHYDSNCGNGTYYQTTLSKAQSMGLTPCKKCAGG